MIETKDTEINGSTYSVTQMPGLRALRMQARLLRILGPCVSEIMIAGSKDLGNADAVIPKALMLLTDQLDEKTFAQLVVDLLESTRRDGKELKASVIDLEFAGKTSELYLVLKFVLEVNYGDFLQLLDTIKGLMKSA